MAREVARARIAPNKHLIIQYKDGSSDDLGVVVGDSGTDGADGLGIARVQMQQDTGQFRVYFTDDTYRDLGVVPKGDKGERGEKGERGDPGAEADFGPVNASISELQVDVGSAKDTIFTLSESVTQHADSLTDIESRIANVPNKTEAQMVASGDIANALLARAAADGSTPFAAAGAIATRHLRERFAEVANLLDFKHANETQWDGAMTRALATGLPVEIPYSATAYTFTSGYALPSGTVIYGKGGRPTLKPVGSSSRLFTATGASNVVLRDLIIDGTKTGMSFVNAVLFNSSMDCLVQRVRLQGNRRGFRFENGCQRVTLDQWECRNIEQHSVEIDGATTHSINVLNGDTRDGLGFGVYLGGAANKINIVNNRSVSATGQSLELVGATQACYEIKVIGNHAENLNDTGISITAYLSTIANNTVLNCQGNGIHIYGEGNTVSGNVLRNNARGYAGNALWRAGIAIQAGFGGSGQYNVVYGNTCDDNQATKTQQYGVWIGPHSYETWTQKTWEAERYVTYAGNIYQTVVGGASGSTPPTHTSGTVSDGGVAWTFIRTPKLGLAPSRNQIVANNIIGYALAPYGDTGNGTGNEFVGGFTPALSVDPLVTSTITNSGGVAALSTPGGTLPNGTGYNWPSAVLNGTLPKVIIAPPTGSGSTATAELRSVSMIGFGTVSPIGSGYTAGDILTIQGGSPITSATNFAPASPRQLRVASVDANGGITNIDSSGTAGTYVYALPWLDGASLTGGTGTGAKLTATAWRVSAPPTVTASGSGYTAAPEVSYSPKFGGTAATTVTMNAQVTLAAGAGSVIVNSTGTQLGVAGTANAVRTVSPSANGTVVRWLPTGNAYTVPVGCDLVRFTNTAAYGTSVTITLPASPADGQFMQFTTGAFAMNSVNFSPAVLGWSLSSIAAYTSVRMRWDATANSWMRE